MRSNQGKSGILGNPQRFQEHADQSSIRDAFVGMARHLHSRPRSRRSSLDEVAAGRAATPGWALVCTGRACLEAARDKGDDAVARTRAEIDWFFDTLKAATVRGHDCTPESMEAAIIALAREHAEAQASATRYACTRAPHDAEHFRREVHEAVTAGERVLELSSRLPIPSRPLNAVR